MAITGFCLGMMKRRNYLFFVTWSYYVITLLPVIGIIQVGSQAAADRYTYLPSLCIFLLGGMGVLWTFKRSSLINHKRVLGGLLLALICIVIFLLGQLTIKQIKIWQNPEIFWSYVINAFPKRVPNAYNNLGLAYAEKGRLNEAIMEYKRALALKPGFAKAHTNLGNAYFKKGMLDEAIIEHKKALNINPNLAKAYNNLGMAYGKMYRLDEAVSKYKKALAINPNFAEAHTNLGNAYLKKGMLNEAIAEHKKALNINPNLAETHYNLGIVY